MTFLNDNKVTQSLKQKNMYKCVITYLNNGSCIINVKVLFRSDDKDLRVYKANIIFFFFWLIHL